MQTREKYSTDVWVVIKWKCNKRTLRKSAGSNEGKMSVQKRKIVESAAKKVFLLKKYQFNSNCCKLLHWIQMFANALTETCLHLSTSIA